MKEIFDKVSLKSSKITTLSYSTSFSLGIKLFHPRYRMPIYAIYGFVRFADEIVDTFHDYDKRKLFDDFKRDAWQAINEGISLNPIINSFQWVVNRYNIDHGLIETFLDSMEMDLEKKEYDQKTYEKYILGSAEVVGLMCLFVFLDGDREKYEELKQPAMRLGSAFQKVNFLRDLHADHEYLGRTYFPGIDINNFTEATKAEVEQDIARDFSEAYIGIKALPKSVRLGVYLAYVYYMKLFNKIKKTNTSVILKKRVRIPNSKKIGLLFSSYLKHSFNLL